MPHDKKVCLILFGIPQRKHVNIHDKGIKRLHSILKLQQNGFIFYHSDMGKSTFWVYLKNVLQIDISVF